jgi:hypothetical protein
MLRDGGGGMENKFALSLINMQKMQAVTELEECNEYTAQYGLALSVQEIQSLVERRFNALKDTGRMEFGHGILKKIITVFCDSPYITQGEYEDTIVELQDSFYHFKNESMDRITDEQLIQFMKMTFDGAAQGSMDYLNGTSLEELCRITRSGRRDEDTDIEG